jgi:hypothetical protein
MTTSSSEEARYEVIIRTVLSAVDDCVPTELPMDEISMAILFALAAIRRMADLIDVELRLALQDCHSVTRVLGRCVTELWLYGNELLLNGEDALERLFGEDADQQARLEHGRRMVWDRLESQRDGGIKMHDADFIAGERERANVEALAIRVRALREGRGLGGGIAEVRYELDYRYDSAHDVHVGVDLLFRYLGLGEGDLARVFKEPCDEDSSPSRGWDSVYNDTRLLADILGVYLEVAERHEELAELRSRLAP